MDLLGLRALLPRFVGAAENPFRECKDNSDYPLDDDLEERGLPAGWEGAAFQRFTVDTCVIAEAVYP